MSALGAYTGDTETRELARQANENEPILRTHDRYGNRIDEVEFHPAWHELLGKAVEHEIPSFAWNHPEPGAHVARTTLMMLCRRVGRRLPGLDDLRDHPGAAQAAGARGGVGAAAATPLVYDRRFIPAPEKAGALAGMGMTEKQGGSDVRANTTTARPVNGGGPAAEYELTGHKWFFSAPMCDVFLVLAQAEGGLSCFLLPRFTPDGERNRVHIQRLKDKLGNRSNASSEVEFRGAWAQMVGEEGRAFRRSSAWSTTRAWTASPGSASGMRHAVEHATWHTAHRAAFGKLLADQPLMQNVLADLCVESEAATVTALRLARAFDDLRPASSSSASPPPCSKYWVCKRAPVVAGEALECFGGNGYVEESGMPRLYREMPLNSIWEGSGNVQCLDVLRALAKPPAHVRGLLRRGRGGSGADPRLDAFIDATRGEFADPEGMEPRARRIVERMAKALQGSLLVRFSPPAVADAYFASRLDGDAGLAFGTLPAGTDFGAIVERHHR